MFLCRHMYIPYVYHMVGHKASIQGLWVNVWWWHTREKEERKEEAGEGKCFDRASKTERLLKCFPAIEAIWFDFCFPHSDAGAVVQEVASRWEKATAIFFDLIKQWFNNNKWVTKLLSLMKYRDRNMSVFIKKNMLKGNVWVKVKIHVYFI